MKLRILIWDHSGLPAGPKSNAYPPAKSEKCRGEGHVKAEVGIGMMGLQAQAPPDC